MFARLTGFSMNPAHREEATAVTHRDILPTMRDQPGFVAMHVLMDLSTGSGLVYSLWDSAEHEEASRPAVAQRFAVLGPMLAGPPEPSKVFEVVVSS